MPEFPEKIYENFINIKSELEKYSELNNGEIF